jgi:hypothetical protein
MVAKHFCMQQHSVTIVEPNEDLKFQTAEKLGLVDFGISVITIDHAYQYGVRD